MSIFITCPVESVDRATAFYTALGWTLNAQMSDHNVSCFAIAPEQYVMLGSREMYASVGGVEELIGGPHTPSKVTVSFDLGSREEVDALVAGIAATGWHEYFTTTHAVGAMDSMAQHLADLAAL